MTTTTAIVGGGAAGCFAAINIKQICPESDVTIYESGERLLAKVAITGGGRCNLTNSFEHVRSIDEVYPRGARLMKRLFKVFDHRDTYHWFEANGVRLTTQADGCVFPQSQDAMEIVAVLTRLLRNHGVKTVTRHRVAAIEHAGASASCSCPAGRYTISFANGCRTHADNVVVATGGSPRLSGLQMLDALQLDIVPPVPSLFAICLPGDRITELSGTVVEHATVGISGQKLHASGPLLITHQGMSGPAILKLSAHAARLLSAIDYKAQLWVNWTGDANVGATTETIRALAERWPQKMIANAYPTYLNGKLWRHILLRNGISSDRRWAETGRKTWNKMAAALTADAYVAMGKNRFKDEFVTCGGVALTNVAPSTLECRQHAGLYFAGEVLDVDAVTGGFNLQAAWTMGRIVAQSICAAEARQD